MPSFPSGAILIGLWAPEVVRENTNKEYKSRPLPIFTTTSHPSTTPPPPSTMSLFKNPFHRGKPCRSTHHIHTSMLSTPLNTKGGSKTSAVIIPVLFSRSPQTTKHRLLQEFSRTGAGGALTESDGTDSFESEKLEEARLSSAARHAILPTCHNVSPTRKISIDPRSVASTAIKMLLIPTVRL